MDGQDIMTTTDPTTGSASAAPTDAARSGAYFEQIFAGQPLLGILRGFTPEETVARARRAWDLGITCIEVPVERADRLPALLATIEAGRERGHSVGAGTVTTVEQVRVVREAGAAFTVAPGYDPDVAAASQAAGMPHLPGVMTSTEIQAALRAGHTWLKVFPARALGTHYLQSLRGPFPDIKVVATGGMDAHNAPDYLDAGADVVAVGSALADPQQLSLLAALMRARQDAKD
jgi:2-dehydro-3-deoxyphosphogluconate aldolase/(4S)-4-hydroxy-2-oxoglutarate aldolase